MNRKASATARRTNGLRTSARGISGSRARCSILVNAQPRSRPRTTGTGHRGRAPAQLRALYQRPDHQRHRRHRGEHACQVEPAAPIARRVRRHDGERQGERGEGERHVDEEHRGPPEVAGEHAACQDTDHQPGCTGGAPDAQSPVAFPALFVGGVDEDEGRREHQCPAEALHHPGRELGGRPGGQAACERGGGVEDQPGDQHPPPAEQVGRTAAEEQEPAGRHGVGGHDQLQGLRRVAQRTADGGQRHDDDVLVERDDQHRGGHQEQEPPAPARAPTRVLLNVFAGSHVVPPLQRPARAAAVRVRRAPIDERLREACTVPVAE